MTRYPWCGSRLETAILLLQCRRGDPIQVCPWYGFCSETATSLYVRVDGVIRPTSVNVFVVTVAIVVIVVLQSLCRNRHRGRRGYDPRSG